MSNQAFQLGKPSTRLTMSMLSPQEQEKLGTLLQSHTSESIQLGISLLSAHPSLIPQYQIALTVIGYLHPQEACNIAAKQLLDQHYSQEELQVYQQHLRLFEQAKRPYNHQKPSEQLTQAIAAHEEARSLYEDFLTSKTIYGHHYFEAAELLSKFSPMYNELTIQYYQLAVKTNPKQHNYAFNLGIFLSKIEGRAEEAIQHFQQLLQEHPSDAASWMNIGYIYQYRLHQAEAAYRAYGQGLRLAPNEPAYIEAMALLCMYHLPEIHHKELAKTLLLRLLDMAPEIPEYWDNWAYYCWMIAKDYEGAKEAYTKGLNYAPSHPILLGNLAELYKDVYQDYQQALLYYQKAVRANASSFHIVSFITLLVQEWKDYRQARIYYKKLQQQQADPSIPKPRFFSDEAWQAFKAVEQQLWEKFPALKAR